MKTTALIGLYVFFFFMYFIGFDLIGHLNTGRPYPWSQATDLLSISRVIYTVAIVLLTHFFVLRRWYYSKPRYKLILALLGMLALFIILRYCIEEWLYPAWFQLRNYYPGTSLKYYIVDNIYYGSLVIGIGVGLFLLDEQFRNQRKQAALLRQSREAELKFLRMQMNPHFLFNSLNNIYALSYNHNPAATDAILKLSQMMRYVTYEKGEWVPLEKELSFVNDLISLHRLRLDYEMMYTPEISEEAQHCGVPPLTLIPLIENALKHGQLKNHPLRLQAFVQGQALQIVVQNHKAPLQKDTTGGVGLQNIRQRLALLYPAGSYRFEVKDAQDVFTVTLSLPLKQTAS
jgi:two-component system, LytTR family, sensor kinase